MTPAGAKLDRLCRNVEAAVRWNQPIPGARMPEETEKPAITKPAPARSKPQPGAKFLSLLDEMEASGRRLDLKAEVLVDELKETERLAGVAIEARRTQNEQVRDYIERVRGVADRMTNGGPTVTEDSVDSSQSSNTSQG